MLLVTKMPIYNDLFDSDDDISEGEGPGDGVEADFESVHS
jgi:hypothetical protein